MSSVGSFPFRFSIDNFHNPNTRQDEARLKVGPEIIRGTFIFLKGIPQK